MSASIREGIRSWAGFAVILLLIFAARSVFADWNPVPTGSMKPTIMEGDVIFVNRAAYDLKVPFTTRHIAEWGEPRRGDIVVFKHPVSGTRLVKRVVGVPGDELQVLSSKITINGEALDYAALPPASFEDLSQADVESHKAAIETLGDIEHPVLFSADIIVGRRQSITIPDGQYFMMGDHRNNSSDSRVFGLVPRHLILGRSSRILISVDTKNRWKPRWHRFFQPFDELTAVDTAGQATTE